LLKPGDASEIESARHRWSRRANEPCADGNAFARDKTRRTVGPVHIDADTRWQLWRIDRSQRQPDAIFCRLDVDTLDNGFELRN